MVRAGALGGGPGAGEGGGGGGGEEEEEAEGEEKAWVGGRRVHLRTDFFVRPPFAR